MTILCNVSSYNLSFQEKMDFSPQSQSVLCSKVMEILELLRF